MCKNINVLKFENILCIFIEFDGIWGFVILFIAILRDKNVSEVLWVCKINILNDILCKLNDFERFKVDDKVLPLSYENDNVDILVKTVDHTIDLNSWTTKIGTISAPAKK